MLQFLYICSICKETVTSIAPEDGRISPKHVELKEHIKILNCIKLVNHFIFRAVNSLEVSENWLVYCFMVLCQLQFK